jgi:hypothetical protein
MNTSRPSAKATPFAINTPLLIVPKAAALARTVRGTVCPLLPLQTLS